MALDQAAFLDDPLSRKARLDHARGPFQTQLFCDSVKDMMKQMHIQSTCPDTRANKNYAFQSSVTQPKYHLQDKIETKKKQEGRMTEESHAHPVNETWKEEL